MKTREIFLGLAFALIWSSAFTSARISMFDAPPFLLLSVRFLLSGIVALGLATYFGQKVIFSKLEWISIGIFGICQNTIYLGLNFVAMQWLDASMAAVIASLLPLIVTIFSWIFLKETLSRWGVFGLLAGIAGVTIIMSSQISTRSSSTGILLCAIGVLSLAIATIIVRNTPRENMLSMVGIQMLFGSITLFPLSLILETWEVNWTINLLLSFSYTTIFPGLIGTLIWFHLLHSIGPIKAAAFHFLNPFFGVLIANIILSEYLYFHQIVGVTLVTLAIMILQLSNVSKINKDPKNLD